MNKRILAVLMALLMVAVGSVAMGDTTTDTSTDMSSITLNKTYTGAGKPAQTFSFTVDATGAPNGVTPNDSDITIENIIIAAGETTGDTLINLPIKQIPGVYTYQIKETANGTAGIVFDTTVYELKVTFHWVDGQLIRSAALRTTDAGDSNKHTSADFENVYTATTADQALTVSKVIAGSGADARDEFEIKVTFPKEMSDKTLVQAPSVAPNTAVTVTAAHTTDDYVFNITGINGGESVAFYNLPAGWEWNVAETRAVGSVTNATYTSVIDENGTGTIALAAKTVNVTNTYDMNIDTGVNTDTLPYIMLMAIVAAAAVIFVMKKRAVRE